MSTTIGINKPFTTIKGMAEKGKIVVKKWDFRGKKRVIGRKK